MKVSLEISKSAVSRETEREIDREEAGWLSS